MLNTAMRDPKFAAANTMGISEEAQALKDLDPASPEAARRDALNNPRFVEESRKDKLRKELIAGQGGADKANTVPPEAVTMYDQGDVEDMLSEERSRIAAALPKQSAATAPAVASAAPAVASTAPAVASTAPLKVLAVELLVLTLLLNNK
jgi:4-hydroxyphenylpyruvate dioxygenase-like putative hemolysin